MIYPNNRLANSVTKVTFFQLVLLKITILLQYF